MYGNLVTTTRNSKIYRNLAKLFELMLEKNINDKLSYNERTNYEFHTKNISFFWRLLTHSK